MEFMYGMVWNKFCPFERKIRLEKENDSLREEETLKREGKLIYLKEVSTVQIN
jgi:hypothetical protein